MNSIHKRNVKVKFSKFKLIVCTSYCYFLAVAYNGDRPGVFVVQKNVRV